LLGANYASAKRLESKMARAQDLLNPDDYRNYRNVRAVSILFVLLGSIIALGGLATALDEPPPNEEPIPLAASIIMGVVGLAGAVGGIAVLVGHPTWAKMAYVMAVFYIFGFPVGTILSYVMLKGLGRYLQSKQVLRQARIA